MSVKHIYNSREVEWSLLLSVNSYIIRSLWQYRRRLWLRIGIYMLFNHGTYLCADTDTCTNADSRSNHTASLILSGTVQNIETTFHLIILFTHNVYSGKRVLRFFEFLKAWIVLINIDGYGSKHFEVNPILGKYLP